MQIKSQTHTHKQEHNIRGIWGQSSEESERSREQCWITRGTQWRFLEIPFWGTGRSGDSGHFWILLDWQRASVCGSETGHRARQGQEMMWRLGTGRGIMQDQGVRDRGHETLCKTNQYSEEGIFKTWLDIVKKVEGQCQRHIGKHYWDRDWTRQTIELKSNWESFQSALKLYRDADEV